MTHALINFSLSSTGGLGGAAGVEGQRDGKFREGSGIVFVIHVEYLLLHNIYIYI